MDADRIAAGLAALAELATSTRQQAPLLAQIGARYVEALRGGGKLLFAGNGGSAADAQHLATEYVVRFRANRPALAAIALTTDGSLLTAAANDLGFEEIFARQVEALGRRGDLLILHSISGRSPNLLAAAKAARAAGLGVVAMVGRAGTPLADLADLVFAVGTESHHLAQEIQMAVEHLLVAEVETGLGVVGSR
jgi:D-sedoheptulose 7-phosphate isomerase